MSSDEDFSDIDSEIEVRLYSQVHHQHALVDTLDVNHSQGSEGEINSTKKKSSFINPKLFTKKERRILGKQAFGSDQQRSSKKRRLNLSQITNYNKPSKHAISTQDCSLSIAQRDLEAERGNQPEDCSWFISQKDLCKKGGGRSEYRRRQLWVVCNNCSGRGHLSKCCPVPLESITCYICGFEGHRANRCPKLSCSFCWGYGHSIDDCRSLSVLGNMSCGCCGARGHITKHCPNYWRCHHTTIEQGQRVEIATYKHSYRKFCCNCGRSGHFVDKCSYSLMDAHIKPNRLEVTEDIQEIEKRINENRAVKPSPSKITGNISGVLKSPKKRKIVTALCGETRLPKKAKFSKNPFLSKLFKSLERLRDRQTNKKGGK